MFHVRELIQVAVSKTSMNHPNGIVDDSDNFEQASFGAEHSAVVTNENAETKTIQNYSKVCTPNHTRFKERRTYKKPKTVQCSAGIRKRRTGRFDWGENCIRSMKVCMRFQCLTNANIYYLRSNLKVTSMISYAHRLRHRRTILRSNKSFIFHRKHMCPTFLEMAFAFIRKLQTHM